MVAWQFDDSSRCELTRSRPTYTLTLVLPETLDPETLRNVILVLIAVLMLTAIAGWYLVGKMISRVIFFGTLIGLGSVLWSQRAELQSCQQTCSCKVLSWEVQVPGCANPENDLSNPVGLGPVVERPLI